MTGVGLTEERFREMLDERGILRPGALGDWQPNRTTSFVVFSQRSDACLDLAHLKRNAAQFFATKVGLTLEKRYGAEGPAEDAARVVVASDDGLVVGTRLCFGRPSDDRDALAGPPNDGGLRSLAQRCPTVWVIASEGGDDDRVALLLAAIFASVMLGPIVPPSMTEIYGVRTARLKLEKLGKPYR